MTRAVEERVGAEAGVTTPELRVSARASLAKGLGDRLSSILVPLAVVLLWWGVAALGVYPESLLPSPARVAKAAYVWVTGPSGEGPYSGTWGEGALASGQRVLLGYALAVLVGVGLGILIGYFPLIERLIDPLVQVLRPIPMTAWVPLTLVFFGFQLRSAVFLIALGSFFPIIVNTVAGVKGVERTLVKVGHMMGASTFQLLRLFVFPASLPSIFTGLRLGVGVAWLLVIVAEMLAVKSGIGYTLLDAYYFLRYDVVIAAMVSMGLLGFCSDRLIVALEHLILRWRAEVTIRE